MTRLDDLATQDLDYATDEQLEKEWLSIGEYKLSLRKLALSGEISFAKIRPYLRRANERIDLIWDEILKRQINPWWPRKRGKLPPPVWDRYRNFLRSPLPSVFR